MTKRTSSGPPAAVGGSSLLVIFAVLCLTVFALLTLSTAAADSRLSQEAARAVEDYYEADAEAEAVLARLRAGEVPEGVAQSADGGETLYQYVIPISDTQELQVAVKFMGNAYTVLQWQACSTVDWEADSSLDVWDGE